MAKTISQRISLEGAEDIRRQLEQLATAAARAFDQIAQAARGSAAPINQVGTAAAQAGRELVPAAQAASSFAQSATQATTASQGFSTGLRNLAIAAAGVTAAVAGLGVGLFAAARSAATLASSLGRAADAAKIGIVPFQQSRNALMQTGLSAEEAGAGIKKFGDESRKVTETARVNFKKMGLVFADTAAGSKALQVAIGGLGRTLRGGKPALDATSAAIGRLGTELTPDALREFAQHLATIADEGRRTETAVAALGEVQGRFLARLSPAEIEDYLARARQWPLITDEQRAASDKFNGALAELSDVSGRARAQLGQVFAPILTPLIRKFTELIYSNKSALTGLAESLRDALIPVVEDFIKLLSGAADEEIGTQWLLTLRDGFNFVKDSFRDLIELMRGGEIKMPWIKTLVEGFKEWWPVIVGVGGALFLFRRELTALTAVGLFDKLTGAVTALYLVFGSLYFIVSTFAALGGPVTLAILGLAGAMLLLANNGALAKQALQGLGVEEKPATAIVDGVLAALRGLEAVIGPWITWQKAQLLGLGEAIVEGLNIVVPLMEALASKITPIFTGIWDGIVAGWQSALSGFASWALQILTQLAEAAARIFNRPAGGEPGTTEGFQPPGFARGGMVRGPGSATSDSILARLSRGEFVMRAAAVRGYGADLFDALNRMRLDPAALLGGLAGPAGAASPERALTLVLGGERFQGLRGPTAVIDNLERYATLRRARALGARPNWVAG